MITALVPVILLIIGLLMYFAASNPKVQRISEIMFMAGLLVAFWPYQKSFTHLSP